MFFKDIIGQDDIKQQLINSAQNNKVSQAMLFLGKEGVGKLPMALAFAQYLNCENPGKSDSCGVCGACVKSQKLMHPDVYFTHPTITRGSNSKPISRDFIEEWRKTLEQKKYINYAQWLAVLDNENKQGNITADECAQIIRQHSLRHFEGKYKIQIIWGGEYLRIEGNRLLKIIEEPPANTIFMILANQQNQILPTILSRTQIVKFPQLSTDLIALQLVEQGIVDEENAQLIAHLSDGSWIEALKLSEETENDFFPLLREWLLAVTMLSKKSDITYFKKLQDWVNSIGGFGRQQQKIFLEYALFYLRECILIQNGIQSKLSGEELDTAQKISNIFSWESISKMSEIINNLHYQIERNANAKIGLMSTSLKFKALLQKQKATV
jgi:DNA polymerase-3 subunit delta'